MELCIFGASSDAIDSAFKEAGVELGRMSALRGHSLVFGGGDHGMMGALARGFHLSGGKVVSVAPSFFGVDGVLYAECDEYIFTETMRERKQTMEDRAQAFIVTPGGVGTFEEFFEILTLRQLARHKKPIAIYNINGYYDPMLKFLDYAVKESFMAQGNMDLFLVSDDPEEILSYVESAVISDADIGELRNLR